MSQDDRRQRAWKLRKAGIVLSLLAVGAVYITLAPDAGRWQPIGNAFGFLCMIGAWQCADCACTTLAAGEP